MCKQTVEAGTAPAQALALTLGAVFLRDVGVQAAGLGTLGHSPAYGSSRRSPVGSGRRTRGYVLSHGIHSKNEL